MSFLKKALSVAAAPLTGGASLAYLADKGKREAEDAQKHQDALYLNSQAQAEAEADKRISDMQTRFYGSSLDSLGEESTDYTNRLKGLLDRDVARADMAHQQSSQQRALDNARAGLYGTDMSAQNEQSRRNAHFEGQVINEDARRSALGMYGDSISNRISGANTIDTQQKALAIAQLQQPTTQSNPGIIGQIFGGLF